MKYDDENWIKIYTRDTAGWVALSWQARGLALELSRKLPKGSGELSLGRRGLEALGPLLRAPWSEIESAVRELIEDGRLEYDQVAQVIRDPQHVERQNAVSTGAVRTQKWRDSRRASAEPAPPVTSRDGDRHAVTNGDAATAHGDETRRPVTLRDQKKRIEEKDLNDPPAGGLMREVAPPPDVPGSMRALAPDEPLTDQRRKDFAGQTANVPERPIEPEWSAFVDDRIKRSALFGSEGAIDADWRNWVRRENRIAAERRQKNQARGRPDTRQPLRDPNPSWLRRAASGENDL